MSVSLITQSSSEQSICFTVPEKEAARRPRAPGAGLRRRDRPARGRQRPGAAGHGHRGRGRAGDGGDAGHRRPGVLRPGRGGHQPGGHRPGLVRAQHLVRGGGQRRRRPRRWPSTRPSSCAKIGGGRASHPAGLDVVILGFGEIGRTLAGLLAAPQARAQGRRPCGWWGWSIAAASSSIPAGLASRRVEALARVEGGGAGPGQRRPAGSRPPPPRRWPSSPATPWPGRCWSMSPPPRPGRCWRRRSRRAWTWCWPTSDRCRGPRASATPCWRWPRPRAAASASRPRWAPACRCWTPTASWSSRATRCSRSRAASRAPWASCSPSWAGGGSFSEAVRSAMDGGSPSPTRATTCRAPTSARKALILGRLLGYGGDPGDVVVESLVPAAARTMSKERVRRRARVLGRRLEEAGRGAPRPGTRCCATWPP